MRRFAFRYLLKQKTTTLSIIIGIALTVIMMFSLIQMGDSIAVRYKNLLIKGMQYDFSLRDMTEEKQTELFDGLTDGTYNVDSYLILNESCSSTLPSNGMQVSVIGSEGDAASVFGFELAEGTFPTKPYEVCIEERINTYSDITYKVGDFITLAISCRNGMDSVVTTTDETFVITGFFKDLPTGSSFLMMNTTLATAEDISQKQYYDDNYARSIYVTVDEDSFDTDEVYAMIQQMGYANPLQSSGIQFEMNDAKMQAYEQSVGDSYVSVALKVLTIVLSVASVFLIYNSINMSVTEKIRQYGTFRCLGMKRSQLTNMVLIEVLIYSFLGIGFGLALGILLNLCVAQSIMSLILGGEVLLAQRPVTYFLVLLLATAVIGASTFLSIHRLQKLMPVQALKYTEAEHFKVRSFLKKRRENKVAKRNAFILHFAARNLSRNRGKTAVTFVSIFISALLCMVILNFFLSINPGENVGMNVQLAKYQLYYSGDPVMIETLDDPNDGYISEKLLEEIRGIEGVDHVYSFGTNSFSYSHALSINGIYFSDYVLTILDDELIRKISNSYDLQPDNEIALFYETGEDNLYDIPHDSIAVAKDGSADSGVEFTMSQIEENPYDLLSGYWGDGVLFVNDKLADRVIGEYEYIDLLIASNLTYDQLWTQIQMLDGMNDQIQLADIEAGSEEAMDQLAGILLIATFVMAFTAILAVLNISNTVRSNIQLRQSENGMLRAFGMTNKTLTRIICTENALTGLAAAAAASVTGILTAVLIFPQIDSKFHVIFWIYPLVLTVVFLTCILTAYIPMRSHWKTTIRAHIDE